MKTTPLEQISFEQLPPEYTTHKKSRGIVFSILIVVAIVLAGLFWNYEKTRTSLLDSPSAQEQVPTAQQEVETPSLQEAISIPIDDLQAAVINIPIDDFSTNF